MMKITLCLFAVAACALAKPATYDDDKHDDGRKSGDYIDHNRKYTYHGEYNDRCEHDGFYYRNDDSFVICSNNNAYVQPCAPGSRNSAASQYTYGNDYYYKEFCDVNLVDHGYGVKGRYNGYDNDKSYGYDHDKSYGYDDDKSYGYDNNRRDYNNGYDGNRKSTYGTQTYGGYDRRYDNDRSYDGSYDRRDRSYGNDDRYYGDDDYNRRGDYRDNGRRDRGYYGEYDRYNAREYYPNGRYDNGYQRRDGGSSYGYGKERGQYYDRRSYNDRRSY